MVVWSIVLLFFFNEITSTNAKSAIHFINKRFTRDDVCKTTGETMRPVNGCPLYEHSQRKRSKELKCEDIHDSCSNELTYHCIRFGDKIVEVCAPRNRIAGKCCAQFNEGLGRVVEDYSVSCPECPFHYYSNESMIYGTCVESLQSLSVVQTSTTLPMKFTSEHAPTSTPIYTVPESTVKPNCSFTSGRRKRHSNCQQNNDITTEGPTGNKQQMENFNNDNNSKTSFVDAGNLIFFAALVVFLVVLTTVTAFLLCFKRTAKKPDKIGSWNIDVHLDENSAQKLMQHA